MSGRKQKGERKNLVTNEDSLLNPHNLTFKTHENSLKNNGNEDCSSSDQLLNEKQVKSCSPQGVLPQINGIKITQFDVEICSHLKEHCHAREVARKLSKPFSSVSYRIRRLEHAKLLFAHTGAYNTKTYEISDNLQPLLIHNEERSPAAEITAHGMSFTFPLISGTQPTSGTPYKMNNWTGYKYSGKDHTIRATTKSILVDINRDLGANTVNNLTLKYSELARSFAVQFSESHNIEVGSPTLTRNPHFTVPNSAIGKVYTDHIGCINGDGFHMDKSKSKGDLEMDLGMATAFDYAINDMPNLIGGLTASIGDLSESIGLMREDIAGLAGSIDIINNNVGFMDESLSSLSDTMHDLSESIDSRFASVQEHLMLLAVRQDNHLLNHQSAELKAKVEKLTKENKLLNALTSHEEEHSDSFMYG